ncbi:MAG: hypothetical protein U0Q07_08635 [Acidimicrobiales bacterium]
MTAARAAARAAAPAEAPRPRGGRHLSVVAEGEAVGRRRRRVRWGALSLVVLFLAVFGVVVFQALLVQAQGRLDDADRAIAKEEERARDLRLALAAAESPERIAQAARTRLGMIVPAEQVYLQPEPTDEGRAAFDPATAPPPSPTTTVPTTVPGAGTSRGATTPTAPGSAAKAATPTTPVPSGGGATATTPTTAAKPTTPTTTAKAPTTPTTAKATRR